jgi:hypothetical protein
MNGSKGSAEYFTLCGRSGKRNKYKFITIKLLGRVILNERAYKICKIKNEKSKKK